ncbi:MAG: Wadjet anti-phage system protein JetA family protein [Clostridium fessum]
MRRMRSDIMMTEQGVFLAEFLQKMMKPEWEEFSSYIFNIYNILQNPDQWEPDIYVNALRSVYRNAKQLSGALKRLATFIKKIIERMVREESLRKSDRERPRIL